MSWAGNWGWAGASISATPTAATGGRAALGLGDREVRRRLLQGAETLYTTPHSAVTADRLFG
jgi:hypothetical protein